MGGVQAIFHLALQHLVCFSNQHAGNVGAMFVCLCSQCLGIGQAFCHIKAALSGLHIRGHVKWHWRLKSRRVFLIITVAYKWACGSEKCMVRQSRCPHHGGPLSSSPGRVVAVAAQLSPWAPNPLGDHREQSTSRSRGSSSAAGPNLPPQACLPPQPHGLINKGKDRRGGEKPSASSRLQEKCYRKNRIE